MAKFSEFDPYCSRFFASGGLVVIIFRNWCDVPTVTLSGKAVAFAVYDGRAARLSQLMANWRTVLQGSSPSGSHLSI